MHFQCFFVCPPRFQAIAGLGSFRGGFPASRFRSPDVDVTSVTSYVAHTTGASDAEGYAAPVLSLGAPSPLGPRRPPAVFEFGGRPRKFEVCSHET